MVCQIISLGQAIIECYCYLTRFHAKNVLANFGIFITGVIGPDNNQYIRITRKRDIPYIIIGDMNSADHEGKALPNVFKAGIELKDRAKVSKQINL